MAGYKGTEPLPTYIHLRHYAHSLSSSTCLPATLYSLSTILYSSCILINVVVTGLVIVFVTLPFDLNELWNFHFDFRVSQVFSIFVSFFHCVEVAKGERGQLTCALMHG